MLAEVEAQPKFRRPGEGRRVGVEYLSCFSLWKNHDKRNGERARACPTLLGFEPRIGPRHSCFEEIKRGSEWFADLEKKKKGNKGEVHRLKYSGNLRTTWKNYFRATWEWELPVESQSHESCACANISMYSRPVSVVQTHDVRPYSNCYILWWIPTARKILVSYRHSSTTFFLTEARR